VVIPLYNKELYVKRALDSVLAQTYSDFEIIVIDDGSTDKGPEIVKSYDNQKITFIQQNNTGKSVARNQGIKEANGVIMAFLDADDAWLPHFLETIARLHQAFPEAGIYGTAFAHCYPEVSILTTYSKEKGEQLLNYFRDFLIHGGPMFCTDTFAAPKSILEAVGLYSEYLTIGEDIDLYGKIALSYPVAYSPSICSCYYLDTVHNTRGKLKSPLEVPFLRYLFTFSESELKKRDDYNDIQEYCDYWRTEMVMRNFFSGYYAHALRLFIEINNKRHMIIKLRRLFTRLTKPCPYWAYQTIPFPI
jgi:glycosyltransferase involved in cell wall biosynthesis